MKDHESPRARPHWNECLGTEEIPWAISLCRGEGESLPPTPAELVIVDVVAQHNEQPYQQLASDGDFGLGPSAAMHQSEVGPLEIAIHAGGVSGRLAEGEAQERVALFRDVAEVIFVRRGVDRGGQADVADHVLAVVNALDRSQYDDRGQGRQRADARGRDQAGRIGVGVGGGGATTSVKSIANVETLPRRFDALTPASPCVKQSGISCSRRSS